MSQQANETDGFAGELETIWEHDVVPELSRYIDIPALSSAFDPEWAQTGALHQAGELLLSWCTARDLGDAMFELIELAGRSPVLFGEIAPTDAHRDDSTTLIYGHFDKQPALGPWRDGLEPFRAVREGDRLYGRGSADDGYATFAATCALEILHRRGLGHGRVLILLEASEESGSPDLDEYVAHLSDRIGSPRLIICLDSNCASYDRLWVTASLRGVLTGELRVDVLEEAVHSGLAGGIVPSSFRICRELLSRLEDERTGAIILPELQSAIPAHRADEIAAIAREFGHDVAGIFPVIPGLALAGADPAERIAYGTWYPALEVTGAEGIPAMHDAGNVLRPDTTLKLSIRLPPTCDPERAAEAIKRVLEANPPDGAKVSFTLDQTASGWDAPKLAPWLSRVLDEASSRYFGAPWRALGGGGSIPFMADLGAKFPAAQFLATGVLGPESNAHGPNEFLHMPTVKALTATIAHVLAAAP